MKKVFFLFLILILTSEYALGRSLHVIPQPVEVQLQEGEYNLKAAKIKVNGFKISPINLISFAETIVGNRVKDFNKLSCDRGTLTLQLDPAANVPAEGYLLTVNNEGVIITAPQEKGVFYGLQTLAQMIDNQNGTVPFAQIKDYPRYGYRGAMLDVCRHIFPMEFIKQYIDLLAQYKINTFHWHLSDDQGWRIEIKKYPLLTEIGSKRKCTLIAKTKTYDDIPYGGYYTQEEAKEIVAYAASKYITVIPEIEFPGHATAALAAYPELACGDNPGPFEVSCHWDVHKEVFCPGKEATFKFAEGVLDEIIEIFPSEYIHIGGDECPKIRWKECPYCQKRIKKEKLKDENELQSYFVHRVEKYLNKKGRNIIGWDEILEGGLAPNATVMSWRGTKGGIAAAQMHHDAIMTPGEFLYFDKRAAVSDEEPNTINDNNKMFLTLDKIYGYNPTPSELNDTEKQHIKGVQANLWVEFIQTPNKAFYMVLPRILALSEIAWTPVEKKNWADFSENRLPEHLAVFDNAGLTYRVPEPIGAVNVTIKTSSYTLNYKVPVKGANIFYTIDGRIPYAFNKLYTKPVTITVPAGEERIVKSVVITPSGKRSIVVTTVLSNK